MARFRGNPSASPFKLQRPPGGWGRCVKALVFAVASVTGLSTQVLLGKRCFICDPFL